METPASTPSNGHDPTGRFDQTLTGLRNVSTLLEDLNLAGEDLLPLDGQLLIEAVRIAESIGRRIDTLRVRLATQVHSVSRSSRDSNSILKLTGSANHIELLQRLTHLSSSSLSQRIRLGQVTTNTLSLTGETIPARFPAVTAALDSGHLSVETARTITKALDRRALPSSAKDHHIAAAEVALVESATGLAPDGELPQHGDGIKIMCNVWHAYLDQDGTPPSETEAARHREFWIGKERRGLVPIGGRILPDLAALLQRLFDAAGNPKLAANSDGGPGTSPTGSTESSTECGTEGSLLGLSPTAATGPITPNDWLCPAHRQEYEDHKESCHQFSTESPSRTSDYSSTLPVASGQYSLPDSIEVDVSACSDCQQRYLELLGDRSDTRSAGAKRHDYLASLIRVIAQHPQTPNLNGAPVSVLIHATEVSNVGTAAGGETNIDSGPSFGGEPGFDSGSAKAPSVRPLKPRAFLRDHHDNPVVASRELLHHATCSGTLQRIVFDEGGGISKIEVPDRIFNSTQRRAMIARDGGCVIPGCGVPSNWCEAHHVTEWSKGGPTSIDNGVLLCFHHHRNIENSGWQIKMIDRLPYVQAPPWLDPQQTWHRSRPPINPPVFDMDDLTRLGERLLNALNQKDKPAGLDGT